MTRQRDSPPTCLVFVGIERSFGACYQSKSLTKMLESLETSSSLTDSAIIFYIILLYERTDELKLQDSNTTGANKMRRKETK